MCDCGTECPGEVCRKCMLEEKREAICVGRGKWIATGFVSIKGRCEDCHEKREAFADFVA